MYENKLIEVLLNLFYLSFLFRPHTRFRTDLHAFVRSVKNVQGKRRDLWEHPFCTPYYHRPSTSPFSTSGNFGSEVSNLVMSKVVVLGEVFRGSPSYQTLYFEPKPSSSGPDVSTVVAEWDTGGSHPPPYPHLPGRRSHVSRRVRYLTSIVEGNPFGTLPKHVVLTLPMDHERRSLAGESSVGRRFKTEDNTRSGVKGPLSHPVLLLPHRRSR